MNVKKILPQCHHKKERAGIWSGSFFMYLSSLRNSVVVKLGLFHFSHRKRAIIQDKIYIFYM